MIFLMDSNKKFYLNNLKYSIITLMLTIAGCLIHEIGEGTLFVTDIPSVIQIILLSLGVILICIPIIICLIMNYSMFCMWNMDKKKSKLLFALVINILPYIFIYIVNLIIK